MVKILTSLGEHGLKEQNFTHYANVIINYNVKVHNATLILNDITLIEIRNFFSPQISTKLTAICIIK